MSSLLDGIDVKDPATQSAKAKGPSAAVIKGAVAAVLLLAAGSFFAMQAGLIPSPFARGQQARFVPDAPQDPEIIRATNQRLEQEQAEFIKRGGHVGDS
jgi:hypothetical protein